MIWPGQPQKALFSAKKKRGDRIWRRAPIMSVLTPHLGHGGRLRRVWGLHVSLRHGGGGFEPIGVLPSSLQ